MSKSNVINLVPVTNTVDNSCDFQPDNNLLLTAANNMITLSSQIQDLPDCQSMRQQDPMLFLREICTIRLQCSRRSGHSTTVSSLSYHFEQPIIILKNEPQEERFKHQCSPTSFVTRYSQISNFNRLHREPSNCIIIDIASCYKEEEIDSIYRFALQKLVHNDKFYLIFLG